MKNMSFDELATWCRSTGYAVENWRPSLPSATRQLDLALPTSAHALSELIDDVVNIADTERVVWIRDWTIWNERSQEIGLSHLHLLVDAVRPHADDKPSYAYLLTPLEWRET